MFVMSEVNALIIHIQAKKYSLVTYNFTSTSATTQYSFTYQDLSCVLLSLFQSENMSSHAFILLIELFSPTFLINEEKQYHFSSETS